MPVSALAPHHTRTLKGAGHSVRSAYTQNDRQRATLAFEISQMRFPAILSSLLLLTGPSALAAEARSACDRLSDSEISAIAGEAMRAGRERTDSPAGTCTYTGEHMRVAISVIKAESQSAAIQQFARELARAPSTARSYEPLHGVGTEARYRALDSKGGGSIVARFGDTVVLLNGNLDRVALVKLARAVTAHLAETPHPLSEAHRSE